jgi:hypothetical protein
VVWDLSK